MDYEGVIRQLTRRYGDVKPEALVSVLCPVLIPIASLDKAILRLAGETHYRASFTIRIEPEWQHLMQRGRTGKFIAGSFLSGGPWREITKGRIIDVDVESGVATGEIYTGGSKGDLLMAVEALSENDLLEIDQYGAAAKFLSALVEHSLSVTLTEKGYTVRRMPEDVAKHLGAYYYYDFEVERGGLVRKVEVKSLWGTNTRFARLIHSKTKGYPTSSCRFDTQDIFAVNLFLRSGSVYDFAFARSVPIDEKGYGLPRASKHPEHVNQNPVCEIGNGTWFSSIEEVWELV